MRSTTRRIAALLVIVIATAFLSGGIPRAAAAGGKYIDQKHGFAISLLKGWQQVPTQPRDRLVTAKFMDDDKSGTSTLDIYRFKVAGGAVTTPDTGDGNVDEEEDEEPENPWAAAMPDSALELLQDEYERISRGLEGRAKQMNMELTTPEFPKPKKVKFKKAKVEGEIYILEFEADSKLYFGGMFSVAGIVSNGTEEYLISYSCPPNKAKKSKNAFISSIRSFEFESKKKAKEVDPEDRGKEINRKGLELLDPEKRERIKKDLVGTWKYFDTPHYIVIYNCDLGLAKYIANRVEYMRVNAFEKVFPPPYPIKECGVIRVCKEMKEYMAYGAPGGSAGYWSSGDDELVFPDLSPSKRADPLTIGVMQHEGFHQYIHYALAGNAPPIWFNEGFAEYFFCVSMKSVGKRVIYDKRHSMRYGFIKTAMSAKPDSGRGITPIKEFIWLSQMQHYRNSSLHYSQGWAFCTWLMRTKNERYNQIPVILFQEMQKAFVEQKEKREKGEAGGFPGFGGGGFGRGPKGNPILKAATEKAFEGIDLDELEKDFRKGFKGM